MHKEKFNCEYHISQIINGHYNDIAKFLVKFAKCEVRFAK